RRRRRWAASSARSSRGSRFRSASRSPSSANSSSNSSRLWTRRKGWAPTSRSARPSSPASNRDARVSSSLAPRERMVLRAAREIQEGETVFVGTRLPLLAYLVAKATHAPNAVALYENGLIREAAARELLFTMGDPPNILDATCATTTLDVMGMMAAGRVDLGILGGAEVDRFGNVNSTEVVAEGGGRSRLPGSGGAPDILARARRCVILMPQEARRLVPRVAFRTSPGRGDGPG